MNSKRQENLFLYLALIISAIIVLFLAYSTYNINPFPTDSVRYIYYTSQLRTLFPISEIHEINAVKTMIFYGKEALIAGIWIFQHILHDTQSMYPNILLLIIANFFCAILVYLITKNYSNPKIGFIAFLIYTATYWPYVYILFGAHPPLALMFFLLSIFCLQKTSSTRFFYFFSGNCIGFLIFSSPSSILYIPYFLGILGYDQYLKGNFNSRKILEIIINSCLTLLGFLIIFLFFTLPNPIEFMLAYKGYIYFNKNQNFFFRFQDLLPFTPPSSMRGAGWKWIWIYFIKFHTVLFLTYLASLAYLIKKGLTKRSLSIFAFFSLIPVLMVETIGVAQFSRTYYPWFIGMIATICLAFYHLDKSHNKSRKKLIQWLGILLLILHMGINSFWFFGDVLATSLATTRIYDWVLKNKTNSIYILKNQATNRFVGFNLRSPHRKDDFYLDLIESINDVSQGFILISPVSRKTIHTNCIERHAMPDDPHFQKLFLSEDFSKMVVVSFPTISSSQIWPQEEEICTYRDLILDDISAEDRQKGYAWILDAAKVRQWLDEHDIAPSTTKDSVTRLKNAVYFNEDKMRAF